MTMSLFRRIISLLVFVAVCYPLQAQDKGPWNGKQCAVSLTYDDGLNVHLDYVVPLLDSLGFKGTFYVPGAFPGFKGRLQDWNSAAKKGHELGNHTLFHPCEGKAPGREWVDPANDLNSYTVRRMVDEIGAANTLLEAMDGKTRRTLAYPCGDLKAGDSSYVDQIKRMFAGARGVGPTMQKMNEIDLYNIGCFMVNGQSGQELIRMVQDAMAKGKLLVFLFHGVGGEHAINEPLAEHRRLLEFLKENERNIWVAPMVDICGYIQTKAK
jgi:peptidoglycan-N-acetylglucosamine deacetylase